MPRLSNLTDRSQLPEALRPTYDRIAELRQGTVSGPYGVLLHSPELAEASAALSNYCRWRSALTPEQREIAIVATARELDALVMWGAHLRAARDLKVSEQTLEAIGSRGGLEGLPDEDRVLVSFVRELLQQNRVSQGTFDALRERLGDQGIVDLTGLVGYYCFVGSVLNTFEIEPAPDFPPLPEG